MWKQPKKIIYHADVCQRACHAKSVSAITWQRRGGGFAAGWAEKFNVRGMKPASLPLLASSLEGKEPVRVNQSSAGSVLNSKSRDELMNRFCGAESWTSRITAVQTTIYTESRWVFTGNLYSLPSWIKQSQRNILKIAWFNASSFLTKININKDHHVLFL